MVAEVAGALDKGRHVVVQAGTGTGKSLGYIVPVVLNGKRTVIATATKALQDQLNAKDLPLVAAELPEAFTWTVLKGRSNYVCLQRLDELLVPDTQLEFDDLERMKKTAQKVKVWLATSQTGDIEEFPGRLTDDARRQFTVTSEECPGARRCPRGEECLAEAARHRAAASDIIVVNLHLYGLDIASDGAVLPEHEVVVFDEVHQLESVMSDAVGTSIGPGRLSALVSVVRAVLVDSSACDSLHGRATMLRTLLTPHLATRFQAGVPASIAKLLTDVRSDASSILTELRAVESTNDTLKQKVLRAQTQVTRLVESVDMCLMAQDNQVLFVEGTDDRPLLRVSPLHVGEFMNAGVWHKRTAVLTSATVPLSLSQRVGLPEEGTESLSVDSPFDYQSMSKLYCSPEFPDRNSPKFDEFVHDELEALINAAGGRTLALFTSNRALRTAVAALRDRVRFPIVTPLEMPRQRLIEEFLSDEATCIFASQSFFQGVDLPGRTLSLVVLDKLPFPRPDDPLLEARRDAVGRRASFNIIDLPIAATSLAQAVGRLIRTNEDRGVVAVLDNRLASAGYRRTLIEVLPPMSRTRHRHEVEAFLRDITA
jgi:ATP-dependent DNA helicase DinG